LGEARSAAVAALKYLLIARTEGNPFFLKEIVRTLVDTGVLVRDVGAGLKPAPTKSLTETQVLSTVQAVLAARIDRLPPEEKSLLQEAKILLAELS
jgi:predicted ATPase